MKMKFNRIYYGWMIVLFLSFMPIVLWFAKSSPVPRFNNLNATTTSLGQLTGLVGVSMFALNIILSARIPWLVKQLNGLSSVYHKHSRLGQAAFILLLFHPLLLISKYSANILFFSFRLGSQNWGKLALGLMFALIILTLYYRPKYNFWKITHKFFCLALFFASLHIWFIPSDVSTNLPLRYYILTLVIVGVFVSTYRMLFRRSFSKKYDYIVSKITKLNDEVTQIVFEPINQQINYSPGQFVFVKLVGNGVSRESHPFSITSGPLSKQLSVTIKNLGDFTSVIADIPVGTKAEIEGPFGTFTLEESMYSSQIWIAGGIGITPFISMAQTLPQRPELRVDLYICLNNQRELIYFQQLKTISQLSNNRLKIISHYSDTQGFITATIIKKYSSGFDKKEIFICAPPKMIAILRDQFVKLGVNRTLIKSEEFEL